MPNPDSLIPWWATPDGATLAQLWIAGVSLVVGVVTLLAAAFIAWRQFVIMCDSYMTQDRVGSLKRAPDTRRCCFVALYREPLRIGPHVNHWHGCAVLEPGDQL